MAVNDNPIGGPFTKVNFKPEAMPRIASSLGYNAPYNEAGFQNFLKSNPDVQQKFSAYQKQATLMAARV